MTSHRARAVQMRSGVNLSTRYPTGKRLDILFNLQSIFVRRVKWESQLWLQGVDPHGFSMMICVNSFYPSFMIKVPASMLPDGHESLGDEELAARLELDRQIWTRDLCARVWNLDPDEDQEKIEARQGSRPLVQSTRIVRMTPLIGYNRGKKDVLMEVSTHSIQDYYKVRKQLVGEGVSLYHDFPFSNQVLQQQGWQYQDWFRVRNVVVNTEDPDYTTNIVCTTTLDHLEKVCDPETLSTLPTVPLTIKCFIRLKALSRDGMVEKKYAYHPDPDLPFDRVCAIRASVSWSDATSGDGVIEDLELTLMPGLDSRQVESESELLERFADWVRLYDPDHMYLYPDDCHPLAYLYVRSRVLQCKHVMNMDRFRNLEPSVYPDEDGTPIRRFELPTRVMFNMMMPLYKKPWLSIELYDLYTISTMGVLRRNPPALDDLVTDLSLVNRCAAEGPRNWPRILEMLRQDVDLMKSLDGDMNMLMEFVKISRVTDTALHDTINGGEQIRVFNRLSHFCLENRFYINPERLSEPPLRLPISQYPPTFPDPPELEINVALRNQCRRKLEEKKQFHRIPQHLKAAGVTVIPNTKKRLRQIAKRKPKFSWSCGSELQRADNDVAQKDEEAEEPEKEGGNVLHPSPGFWEDERIFVLDFASLYPSIIRAFNLSYENVVLRREDLGLPGVNYIYIPVNRTEVAVVVDQPGLLPKLLKLVQDTRKSVKRKMKTEKDPFRRMVLDMEQMSLKVLNNATYGFLGVSQEKGGKLPMRIMMYMTTALGRYLQKKSSEFVGQRYGVHTIYGDTDSIFVWLKPPENQGMEEACRTLAEHFKMDDFLDDGVPFTWPNVVKRYAKQSLDVTQFLEEHQHNAVLYLVAEKLAQEISELFRDPVELELENMSTRVWLGGVKKLYYYSFWDERDPSKVKKTKTTGMADKRRDWCPWTRGVLAGVKKCINQGKLDEIQPLIRKSIEDLLQGRVPIEMLRITKKYKGPGEYKDDKIIHIQVVKKIERHTRWPVAENARIGFVVVRGNQDFCYRGETLETVRERGLKVDYVYYLECQFFKPMQTLLQFHTELFDFNTMIDKYLQRARAEAKGMRGIQWLCGSTGASAKRRRIGSSSSK